jgi:hypothetical protein
MSAPAGGGFRVPWRVLFYLVLLGAAGGVTYFFLGAGSPISAAQRYLELVQMEKKEAAGQLVAGGMAADLLRQKGLRIDDFQITEGASATGAQAEVPVQLKLAVNVTANTLSPDRATMFVELFKALEKPVVFNMSMTKEGWRWKVNETESGMRLQKAIDGILPAELKKKLEVVSKAVPGAASSEAFLPEAGAGSTGTPAPGGPGAAATTPMPTPRGPGIGGRAATAPGGEETQTLGRSRKFGGGEDM